MEIEMLIIGVLIVIIVVLIVWIWLLSAPCPTCPACPACIDKRCPACPACVDKQCAPCAPCVDKQCAPCVDKQCPACAACPACPDLLKDFDPHNIIFFKNGTAAKIAPEPDKPLASPLPPFDYVWIPRGMEIVLTTRPSDYNGFVSIGGGQVISMTTLVAGWRAGMPPISSLFYRATFARVPTPQVVQPTPIPLRPITTSGMSDQIMSATTAESLSLGPVITPTKMLQQSA